MSAPSATKGRLLSVLFVCQGALTSASTKQALGFASVLADWGHKVQVSVADSPGTVERERLSLPSGCSLQFRTGRFGRASRTDLKQAAEFDPDVLHVFNPRHHTVALARQIDRVVDAVVLVHWEDDEVGIRQGVVKRSIPRQLGRLSRRLLCYPMPRQGVFVTPSSLRWVRHRATLCDALTPALARAVEAETGLHCVPVLPIQMKSGESSSENAGVARQVAALPAAHKLAYTGSVHTESIDDIQLAFAAAGQLIAEGHDIGFVYAGKVLPRFNLDELATAQGVSRTRFLNLGYIPFADVLSVLRAADVLVQPGRGDRFNRLRLPSKVETYLESGTPTVMFSVGLGELLEDDTEVVKLHDFDAGELASRVSELLDDPERAIRIGAGGKRAAARLFDPDSNGGRLVRCYETALKSAALLG